MMTDKQKAEFLFSQRAVLLARISLMRAEQQYALTKQAMEKELGGRIDEDTAELVTDGRATTES